MEDEAPRLDLSLLSEAVEPQEPAAKQASQDIAAATQQAKEIDTDVVVAKGEAPVTDDYDFPVEDPSLALSLDEAIQLGAVDSVFFNQLWFPKTFRQAPAIYHPEIYSLLDNPLNRYINIQVCRDGAKTTILRAYSAKRIAYGLSRTILYVALNEAKAKQSVAWLKHQIETNSRWTQAFGLQKSKPWSDEHICIIHNNLEKDHTGRSIPVKIHVLALGINAGVRGVNLDDYRPDLIIIDDVMDDDNSATKEQREKIKDRVLGALKESLSPQTETPDAKMVLLNTPQDFEDLSEDAKKDGQFVSASYGCWTKETSNLSVEEQESSWPARYPSDTLRAEKRAAVARNKYSIFAREKECLLVVAEDCAFRSEWLRFFGDGEKESEPPYHEMWIEMAIDPVPPPSQKQLDSGLKDKDYESFSVVGRWKGKYYLLEQTHNRGHTPQWTVATFWELCLRWRPRKVLVESVAYQATLAWLLRETMRKTGRYFLIEEFKDKRAKYKRIVDGLSGPAGEGAFYCRRSQTTFIGQFSHYPGKNPDGNFDDDLESAAVATGSLHTGRIGDMPDDHYKHDEESIEEIEYMGAP